MAGIIQGRETVHAGRFQISGTGNGSHVTPLGRGPVAAQNVLVPINGLLPVHDDQ
jgi:hypothetical protein